MDTARTSLSICSKLRSRCSRIRIKSKSYCSEPCKIIPTKISIESKLKILQTISRNAIRLLKLWLQVTAPLIRHGKMRKKIQNISHTSGCQAKTECTWQISRQYTREKFGSFPTFAAPSPENLFDTCAAGTDSLIISHPSCKNQRTKSSVSYASHSDTLFSTTK